MANNYVFGSLTRISDLESAPFVVHPLKRDQWATGDYVVGKVISNGHNRDEIELNTGRHARLMCGDLVVGAFGVRRATLEAVGDWHSIGDDGCMEDLTRAGLFGRQTSRPAVSPPQPGLVYVGHCVRDGVKVTMKDFVPKVRTDIPYSCPTLLIIGTSMSAGKTTSARVIIRVLKEMGLRVVGTKLSGAGRFGDIMAFHDAGADAIYDFVDAGLPSSILPEEEYRQSLRALLSRIASEEPDVVVAESGASPFEPYNGSVVLQEVANSTFFTVLCASDPYAVLGMTKSFATSIKPDLVSGIITSTSAGIDLVKIITGIPALSLATDESVNDLRSMLKNALGMFFSEA